MKKLIANLEWLRDDCGEYWIADLFQAGKKIGVTGSYYSVDKSNLRTGRKEQEKELEADYFIIG